MPEQIVTIHNDSKIILNRVKLAQNFRQRLRGLMFYRDFPGIDGLLLYPCKLVHMLWMRFPVDLAYLSRKKEVLFTVDVLVPNKFGPLILDAYYVLEMPAGVSLLKTLRQGTGCGGKYRDSGGNNMTDNLIFELPDGTTCSYPSGTTFREMAKEMQPRYISPIVAVKLNHEIRELYHTPTVGGKLGSIDLSQEDGVRIYYRSLSLVMLRAAEELFPGCKFVLNIHSARVFMGRSIFRTRNLLPKKNCGW